SSLTVEQDQKWVPTHVQVTVLRGRGLRAKGKHGTSDAYAIIQLGKEKYSTGVVERSTEPEWKEECTFELGSGCPAGGDELVLTVMHRAPIGMDVFLGQALLQLEKIFHESRGVKNRWFRLNSKTGKKEKERGDIQLSIQFTRNNLTASMYDLVMKDKGASTFGKLKERMRGKRRSSNEDSSSAILPGGYGSLCRMRQRLPSDGGGEEDYEDDEGGEVRRSKMRTFFLRGKLRKSSDTRSSTSLGSESSESSSRGGSLSPTAGISVVVSDLSNSPSNSSNLTTDNSPKESPGKKQKRSLFSSGRGDSVGKRQSQSRDEPEQASSATEEKHKGRFGFKDSKPPHAVKPLATTLPADEKRTEGRSVLATRLEKLKSTIHPGRSSMLSEQETDRRKSWTEGAGSYYHLNQSELVDLLVQREAELERQREEFEQQKCLLAKREVELKKLKPQVRDLEDYIDTLLVRIMEQKPTLLQVRSKLK
uniref:Uncharacterized protein n=1 Tax=Mola mola TaxID=94237 RepID=A0A3Q3XLZ5_MOLML